MHEWIQKLWRRVSGRQPDRRFFKPPLIPDAFDKPETAFAVTDGEYCVAVLQDGETKIQVSFSIRKPVPTGKWAGVLEVPAAGFAALKGLVEQANEYLESIEDEG